MHLTRAILPMIDDYQVSDLLSRAKSRRGNAGIPRERGRTGGGARAIPWHVFMRPAPVHVWAWTSLVILDRAGLTVTARR